MTTWHEFVEDNRFVPDYLPKFESKLYFEGTRAVRQHTNFFVLLTLATVIATFGLISNSTATVIGAMIVAPLMTPIMATSAAIVMGNPRRIVRSLALVLIGIFFVVLLSVMLALLASIQVHAYAMNAEILSRTTPNLMALVIAVAAGAAGAYAVGREEVADSLPGAAIALSLVPPLCVVGISLSLHNWHHALGALLLFLTNFLAIMLAGGLMLWLLGLSAAVRSGQDPSVRRTAFIAIGTGTLVLAILLFFTGYQTTLQVLKNVEVRAATEKWIGDSGYTISEVDVKGRYVSITIAGTGEVPPLDALERPMSDTVGKPVLLSLRVIPEQLLTFPPAAADAAEGSP